MASNHKEGNLQVTFDPSGVGFNVKGQGLNLDFKTLADFHDAAHAEGLKSATRDAVTRSVIKHFGGQDAAAPLDSQHLPAPLTGIEGVSVLPNRNAFSYEVALPFHPDIVRAMRKVPGAAFLPDRKVWSVPLEARGALYPALEAAGKVLGESTQARDMLLAEVAKRGLPAGTDVKITAYHRTNWIDRGEIIAANTHYAAQLTSMGEGEASVVIHSQASLDRPVFVGDDVGIKYNAKGTATVLDRAQLQNEFQEMTYDKLFSTLGEKVDGITVNQLRDGSMLVQVDHRNARPAAPLHRLDKFLADGEKVSFDRKREGFVVPAAALVAEQAGDVFAKAVADGRREIREDNAARNEILQVAQEKLAGAKVGFPFPKGGEWQEGKILFVNDRYALQASGREFMKAHELRNLSHVPVEGQLVKISYQEKGKAHVEDHSHGRTHGKTHAARRSS